MYGIKNTSFLSQCVAYTDDECFLHEVLWCVIVSLFSKYCELVPIKNSGINPTLPHLSEHDLKKARSQRKHQSVTVTLFLMICLLKNN